MKKYSDNFERDYNFYLNNIENFKFCGTLLPRFQAIYDKNGKSSKEAFLLIDSTGKNCATSEPELLNSLLLCKASVNFHIKQWAEGRTDGTLPLYEFTGKGKTLEWEVKTLKNKYFGWLPITLKRIFKIEDKKIPIPIYKENIASLYKFPDWVIKAVEAQKKRIIENNHLKNK